MTTGRFIPLILAALAVSTLTPSAILAHANTPPPWTVSLDANSTSTTDASIETSYNPRGSFSIGAIINASSTQPVNSVCAWQFSIIYDNTTATPSGSTARDSVHLGSQSGPGNPNWAGQVAAGNAFVAAGISGVDSTHQKILVGFTFIGTQAVTIAPALSSSVQGNLLANVNFTITKTTIATYSISDLEFLDNCSTLHQITTINAGAPITEQQSITPDFFISSSPSMLTIPQGGVAVSTITVTSLANFTGTISLSSSPPSGIIASLSSASVSPPKNGNANSTLTLTIQGSLSPGTFPVTVAGTNGTITHYATVTVQVITRASPASFPLLWTIAGVVAVVALIGAVVYIARRRRPTPQKGGLSGRPNPPKRGARVTVGFGGRIAPENFPR